MLYIPLGVFAARVTSPFTSTLNGPDVPAVTTVLAAVTDAPFKVSFIFTFPIDADADPEDFVPKSSLTATRPFTTLTSATAVLQFAGFADFSQIS